MPNYNAQVPPYSIFPGDVALAFNSEEPGKQASSLPCRVTQAFRKTGGQFAGKHFSGPLLLQSA